MPRPHVLLVTVDQWPGIFLGAAGHQTLSTPTIDQLAANGIRYTRAYTESPVCIPARRTLMTGTTPRKHGDRVYREGQPQPPFPHLAECFRGAGYQCVAVGKLHAFPQRARIGFDDVVLVEEGRTQFGVVDDWALHLGERGFAGLAFADGMSNNGYLARPWHLPEDCHSTAFCTRQMARAIRRRDPTRPGFWYLSYPHPHPPLTLLADYLAMYRERDCPLPPIGAWAHDVALLPACLRSHRLKYGPTSTADLQLALRAYFAQCTYIDHQLRVVIGTLREEGLLDDTVILLTADHGDMLGAHGLWGKRLLYERSAGIPMIVAGGGRLDLPHHRVDDRLCGLQDVMPTLLGLAGIPVPHSVEGRSLLDAPRRAWFHAECDEGLHATRMVHDGRHKLIHYATGNRIQLFDIVDDPEELNDRAADDALATVRDRLLEVLITQLHGDDLAWMRDGRLVGLPDVEVAAKANHHWHAQRGIHWPPATARG